MLINRLCAVAGLTVMCCASGVGFSASLEPESERQIVEVTIKDFTFRTNQAPLRLGRPTVITVRNEDDQRHDFGTTMFEGIPTTVEQNGVIAYGRGLGGVMLDAKRDATIHFSMDRPGRYTFRCSIHPDMQGELLLLSVEAV